MQFSFNEIERVCLLRVERGKGKPQLKVEYAIQLEKELNV